MSTEATQGVSPIISASQPSGLTETNDLSQQRARNDQTASLVSQMQAENLRFQLLMQLRANAYESRKEAIRSTRAN